MTSIMHIFQELLFVCVYIFPVIMSLCDYVSDCLCVFTWQQIDQAGGPETFF